MKFILLLLAVTGLVLIDETKNSNGQLMPIYNVEDQPNLDNDVTSNSKDRSFTPQELKDIHDLAKNISHSKGHIIQSEEGDPEYRRSFIRKVIRETKFEALKAWLTKHINSSGEYSVSDLQELEDLVHQYETAIDFTKLGGMKFLLPLVNHTHPEISSAALSVMTAAMQGNPTVQKYAEDARILDYILRALTGIHCRVTTTALYTLSSFIRNNPVSQLKFFKQDGISILADILKNKKYSLKSKLKVFDLLHDLSFEINFGPETAYESPIQHAQLRRAFAVGFSHSNLCKIIPKYFDYDDVFIHERMLSAVHYIYENVCLKDFKKPHVIEVIKQQLLKYKNNKTYYWLMDPNDFWRRKGVLSDLQNLYNTLTKTKNAGDNDFRLTTVPTYIL